MTDLTRKAGRPSQKFDRNRLKTELLMRTKESYNRAVTPYDVRCEAKLHRFGLSGMDFSEGAYLFSNLKRRLLTLMNNKNYKFDPKKTVCKENPYRKMFILIVPGFRVIIFTKPDLGLCEYRPPCKIIIRLTAKASVRQYKELLVLLDESIPKLQIPSTPKMGPEMAMDLRCRRGDVALLFDIVRTNIFVKGAKEVITYESPTNMTCYLKNKSKTLKIYSRPIENPDRVRIELTSMRRWKTLADFIKHFSFQKAYENVFDFRKFKHSPEYTLPLDYQGYPTQDKFGHAGVFQLEVLARKKEVKNILQYTEPVGELEPWLQSLRECTEKFDEEWRSIIC